MDSEKDGGFDWEELPGFDPTKLEKAVAGNPAFKRLRKDKRWPRHLGQHLTGLEFRGHDCNPVFRTIEDYVPPTPNAAANFADVLLPDVRSLMVLTAKVRRDADPEDPADQRLIENLQAWFDDHHFPGFRWEEHLALQCRQEQESLWEEQTAQLKQGEAQVVLLILHRLSRAEKEMAVDKIETHLQDHIRPSESAMRHYHYQCLECQQCERTPKCQNKCDHGLLLVDCGGVQAVMKVLPRSIQRHTRAVRFSIPRATFGGISMVQAREPCIGPQMLVFLVDQLPPEKQEATFQQLKGWLDKYQQRERVDNTALWQRDNPRTYWQETGLYRPWSKGRLNAAILSGPGFDHNLDPLSKGWLHLDLPWKEMIVCSTRRP